LYGSEGRVGDVIEAAARASQLTAIFVLGLVLASARATDAANRFAMTVTEWELAAVAIGVVCGLLFGLFVGRESESSRIFLATIGLVTFASGIGSALGISPLFVNLLAGVTVSVASPHADKLREQLERLAHPLFVLIMVFAGAMWTPVSGTLWIVVAAYVLFRFASRRAAMSFITGSFLETPLQTPRLGNGLLAQGTLAPAIAVNCTLRFPEFDAVLLSTVLVGALASELWSQQALRKLLDDAGEIPTGSAARAPTAASDVGATS
jgi:Kef-type K+ transport system membrane component KefB